MGSLCEIRRVEGGSGRVEVSQSHAVNTGSQLLVTTDTGDQRFFPRGCLLLLYFVLPQAGEASIMKVILGLEKCQLLLELSTNHREVSQCPKKAPTRAYECFHN